MTWPAQNLDWVKMFDFRRATVFCLRYCLLKHKMTRYSKNLGGALARWLHVCTCGLYNIILCVNTYVFYSTLGPYFVDTNLFIRSFIYNEIKTFGLPKVSNASFAFNTFVLIPVQEMIYLRAIQKITTMNVSVSGTIDQKT